MLCVIVKVYCHVSAGMRCSIASRVQHAEVYCVVLKDSALIGGKQPHDMSEWVCHTERSKGCGWWIHWTAHCCNRVSKLDKQNKNSTSLLPTWHISDTQRLHLQNINSSSVGLNNVNNEVCSCIEQMKQQLWRTLNYVQTSSNCKNVILPHNHPVWNCCFKYVSSEIEDLSDGTETL